MKFFAIPATVAMVLMGSTAMADAVTDLVDALHSQGYTQVEVRKQGNTLTAEGVQNGVQRELVYDLNTSSIVSDETGSVDGTDDTSDDQNDDENDDQNDDENDSENDSENDNENDSENDSENDNENDD